MKKNLYTAIKPTGRITLGNYIGVGEDLKKMQDEFNSYICVADLHALTINMPKEELMGNAYSIFAFYLSLGLDPDKCVLYMQSQVPEHAEIAWVLNNFTQFGEASRMTQFKDYQAKNKNVNVGLFCYPVLMAGDILLYDTDVVPVGVDQKQHVELARNIAIRFNNKVADTFTIPEPVVKKVGHKITGLTDPTKKMSKSIVGDMGTIFLEDSDDVIRKKIKRAITDSDNFIKYDVENKPGVSNLLTIYATLKGISILEAEEHFKNCNYGTLKSEVAETCIEVLSPIRERYLKLLDNKEYLKQVMKKGAEKASAVARKKLNDVYSKVGLITL